MCVCLLRLPALHKQNGKARGPRGPSGWGRLRGGGAREDEGLFTLVFCGWPPGKRQWWKEEEEDAVWSVYVRVCVPANARFSKGARYVCVITACDSWYNFQIFTT